MEGNAARQNPWVAANQRKLSNLWIGGFSIFPSRLQLESRLSSPPQRGGEEAADAKAALTAFKDMLPFVDAKQLPAAKPRALPLKRVGPF